MAANTDKFRKKRSNFSTTLNGNIGSTDATIALNSTSGLPTDTGITLTIDRVDANSVSTPAKRERVTGVIVGSNITTALRGQDNTTAQAHTSGAVVEDIWDGASWNDALAAILVEHNQDGTHLNTVVALLAGAQTITGAKTFGSALLLATRPKITTSLDDTNGNEVFKVIATASAVNEITLTNAATGGKPTIGATGDDTNITLLIKGKGANGVEIQDILPTVVALTDGANIATDASLGQLFTVTLAGNRTMDNPTNATNGQLLVYRITQDGTGSRTISWGTNFAFGTSGAPTLSTATSKIDYVAFRYSSVSTKWHYQGSQLGF